jgi:hypothetical protein
MKVVVPLAGPDFISDCGQIKCLRTVNGHPLLKWVLYNRPWFKRGETSGCDYVFVLKDTPESRGFYELALQRWFPDCSAVFTRNDTRGAALSALLGVATLRDLLDEVICIDLADIYFEGDLDIQGPFSDRDDLGGIGLVFESNLPCYSYFKLDGCGDVALVREKVVISNIASAGAYVYRSAVTYMNALQHSIIHLQELTHNNSYFVCPVFNGVTAINQVICLMPVTNVLDVKEDSAVHLDT